MISVAIDGPSGAGKSTLAKRLAEELGYIYVDTGALYRSIGLAVLRAGGDTTISEDVIKELPNINLDLQYIDGEQRMLLNGEDISAAIRENRVSMAASQVSAYPEVREFLTDTQRNLAKKSNVIMDGRDIGTVILPNADIKIYLTAEIEIRAQRRTKELLEKGAEITFEKVLEDIRERDYNDSHRKVAPLKKADDAICVNTNNDDFEQSFQKLYNIIKENS